MKINHLALNSIKQKFSANIQVVGSFCGKKVEVLKAASSNVIAKIQPVSQQAISKISQAYQGMKKSFTAVKDYVSSKFSAFAAKYFPKNQAPAQQEQAAPAQEEQAAPAQEEQAAPAQEEQAPAQKPKAPDAKVITKSGRVSKRPVRLGFPA
jgi:hypothetical protein